MRLQDVTNLLEWEWATRDSAASWQVRGIWDSNKTKVDSDEDAAALSKAMRDLQDCFFRCLHALLSDGQARFLATLLNPENALQTYRFVGLDPATFVFRTVTKSTSDTASRRGQRYRVVRVAFESLTRYMKKGATGRQIGTSSRALCDDMVASVLDRSRALPISPIDRKWDEALRSDWDVATIEGRLSELWGKVDERTRERDAQLGSYLTQIFYEVGFRWSL